MTGVGMVEVPATLNRTRGDLPALGNPHFMTDPLSGKSVAERIATALGALALKDTDVFQANLARFAASLDSKLVEWRKRLAPFAGPRIVAYHDPWPYFGRRFGLKIGLFLEPKPGIPPTPQHRAEVIAGMKAETIRVIIVEPYQNRRTAETVAAQTGAHIVNLAQYPGGFPGSEDGYLTLIDALVNAVAKALEASK